MYTVVFAVKHRTNNPRNKLGASWNKQKKVEIEGETTEEILDKAYETPVPEGVDAISMKGFIKFGADTYHRKTVRLDVFKEVRTQTTTDKRVW